MVKNRVSSNGRPLFFASQFPFNVKSKILQCIPQLSLENGSKLVSMKERAKSFFWYWCLRTLFLCFLHRNFVVKFPQEKLQRVWKRKMVNTLECRSAADFSTAVFLQRCRHFPLQWRYQKRFIIHASLSTSVMSQELTDTCRIKGTITGFVKAVLVFPLLDPCMISTMISAKTH